MYKENTGFSSQSQSEKSTFLDNALKCLVEHMAGNGFLFPPSEFVTDGRWKRFNLPGGKRSNMDGAYRLTYEPETSLHGSYMSNRDKHSFDFYYGHERQSFLDRWRSMPIASTEHPYLISKKIPETYFRQHDDKLYVPAFDSDNEAVGIQSIGQDGVKRWESGSKKNGARLRLPGDDSIIYIAEGMATGVTIREVTGNTTIVGFDAFNIINVATLTKSEYPGSRIIIAADNDCSEKINVGIVQAKKASAAIGADVLIPSTPEGRKCDFNDIFVWYGADECRRQLNPDNCNKEARQRIECWTGSEILAMNFPPPKWEVEGLLPTGLTLFGGKPKIGKSIFTLNLAVAKATGGRFFGQDIEQGTVLLFGLEDTKQRFKQRVTQMTSMDADLSKLIFYTSFPKADSGGIASLDEQIDVHKPSLVIIDTLKKFRAASNGKKSLYDEHYDDVDQIKQVADRKGVSIVIVHHLRKMESDDPFDSFSGSLGLSGAADSLWVLMKSQPGITLHITGRDMEESQKIVRLEPEYLIWDIVGDADEVQNSDKQQKVYDCIKEHGPIKGKQISDITGIDYGAVRKAIGKLTDKGRIISNNGLYKIKVCTV